MPSAKVSQQIVEVLGSWVGRAKVSQDVVEVLRAFTITPLTPLTDDATSMPIGAYGDECNTVGLDGSWTLRNIASVTGDGAKYPVLMDARGDAMTKAFIDPWVDLNIIAHIKDLTDAGGAIGICAVDDSGSGYGTSRYSDNNVYLWTLSGWANDQKNTPGISGSTLGDHWLHLQRLGRTQWHARFSNNGSTWSAWSNSYISAWNTPAITKIGILRMVASGSSQTVGLERFVVNPDLGGFTGGAMLSQNVVEVLAAIPAAAKVSQQAVEVLMTASGFAPAIDAGVRVHGYAS